MRADVVVVTFNSGERVLRCLEHLAAQTAPQRVIVVDNASQDDTVARIGERFPDTTVLVNQENLGFGRAVNVGAAAGDAEAIVLVNDDAFCEPGFLAAILAPLRADPACGMVAGMTLMPGNDLVDGFGVELDAGLAVYNRLRHRPPGAPSGVLAGPSGGAAAYRRSAFDAAGGFDDALFAYGEDVDLALRLRAQGWTAAAAPGARALHLGGATFGVDSPVQRRHSAIARGFLLRRYGAPSIARAVFMELLVVCWGVARHRTLTPLRGRVAGWRLAGARRVALDPAAIDASITLREALRRLQHGR